MSTATRRRADPLGHPPVEFTGTPLPDWRYRRHKRRLLTALLLALAYRTLLGCLGGTLADTWPVRAGLLCLLVVCVLALRAGRARR